MKMRGRRHTGEQRAEILERVGAGKRSVEEIAREQGISVKMIHNWMRAKKADVGGFIEVPAGLPRATVVELCFVDGTVLRIRG
jgi:transposase-like protein